MLKTVTLDEEEWEEVLEGFENTFKSRFGIEHPERKRLQGLDNRIYYQLMED